LDIASPARFPLEFPGDTDSEAFGWTISVDEVPFTDQPQLRQSLTAVVDRTSVRTPLHLRAIEPGDKLRPLGFHGGRKASDLLSEAHLTEAARRRLPLVADFSGPLWIPGICLDDRAATNPMTENVLVLKFSPLAQ
jgi:tRNA(Ile)-lysidine synthetase-like protein